MINTLKNHTVLLVDDDGETLNTLRNIAEFYFGKVYTASDGNTALEIFDSNKISVIISDYDMPQLDGYKFIQEIRKIDKTVLVIILSNYTDTDKLLNAIKLNLVDYLVKPIGFDKLNSVLNICANKLGEDILLNSDMSYSYNKKELRYKSEIIKLSTTDYKIFEILLENRDSLVPFDRIEMILNIENYKNIALKNSIYRLRKKLPFESMIKNIKNSGYMLSIDE